MPVIGMACWGTHPAGFASTAALHFPTDKKGAQERFELLSIGLG